MPLPGFRALSRILNACASRTLPGRIVRVELHVLGASDMRAWNVRLRSIDRPTDVLSVETPIPPAGPVLLGPIALCPERIRDGATPEERSVPYLFAHGLLHCLGRDHATERAAREMDRDVRALLDAAGIPFGHGERKQH